MMYQRILLASDCSRESLIALREGVLIARRFEASVFLLVVDRNTTGKLLANSVYPLPVSEEPRNLLEFGLARLKRFGLRAMGELAEGEPDVAIASCARQFRPDLIVLGHRRQSLIDRWWSGASGSYVADQVGCSVLVARTPIDDEEFERLTR